VVDLLGVRSRFLAAGRLQAVEQAEGGLVGEGGPGSALDQAHAGCPVAERPRILQRRATGDHGARSVDVGTVIEQGIEDGHIVAAGRPVQGSLRVRTPEPGVDVGAGLDEGRHHLGAAREVSGPVGHDVQQGPGHAAWLIVPDPDGRQRRMLGQQCPQAGDVTPVDRRHRRDRQVIVRADRGHGPPSLLDRATLAVSEGPSAQDVLFALARCVRAGVARPFPAG
jgi:hypothetical protein